MTSRWLKLFHVISKAHLASCPPLLTREPDEARVRCRETWSSSQNRAAGAPMRPLFSPASLTQNHHLEPRTSFPIEGSRFVPQRTVAIPVYRESAPPFCCRARQHDGYSLATPNATQGRGSVCRPGFRGAL